MSDVITDVVDTNTNAVGRAVTRTQGPRRRIGHGVGPYWLGVRMSFPTEDRAGDWVPGSSQAFRPAVDQGPGNS